MLLFRIKLFLPLARSVRKERKQRIKARVSRNLPRRNPRSLSVIVMTVEMTYEALETTLLADAVTFIRLHRRKKRECHSCSVMGATIYQFTGSNQAFLPGRIFR